MNGFCRPGGILLLIAKDYYVVFINMSQFVYQFKAVVFFIMLSRKPDREIIINNNVFELIKNSKNTTVGITETFMLYFNLFLRLAWDNTVDTTGQILLNQLNREKRYISKINNALKNLKKSGLIEVANKNYKRNDIINIKVNIPKNNFTRIRCINEQIAHLPGPPKPHNLISVYIYLRIKENNILNRARVSQNKIAQDLELSPGTVQACINLLFKEGLLNINFGNYIAKSNHYECNIYKTYDCNNRIDNSKYLQIKEDFKEKKILLQDINDPNVFELLLDEKRLNNVNRLLSTFDMCPALLIGKYASEFRLIYKNTIWFLDDSGVLKELIERYSGIAALDGKYLVLDNINILNKPNQDRLLVFVENSELPIILLADYENITPTLCSRMKLILKDPIKKTIAANRLTPHEALENISKFKNNQHKKNYLAERSPKAYCLGHFQISSDKGLQTVDSLISKLSGGKTYREIG